MFTLSDERMGLGCGELTNSEHHFSKWRFFFRIVWVLVFIGAAVYVVNSQRGELNGIGKVFSNLNFIFLVPAFLLECGSMAAYSQLQRSMLQAGNVDGGFWKIAGIFLASNSITNVVPGGPAFASVYSYRRFRLLGANKGLSGWSIFATNVLAAFSLLLLAGIGLVISEGNASGVSLIGAILVVAVIVCIALLLVSRAESAMNFLTRLTVLFQDIFGKSWKVTENLRSLSIDMSTIAPSNARLAEGFIWGFLNWVLDASVLVCAFLATRSAIPFEGLLIAYSAGQLAANFPITPGGLGVVEGSISIALVAFGGNQEATVAAVLLYRLFSFWMWLLPGFGCYLGFRISDSRSLSVEKDEDKSFLGEVS